MRVAAWLRSLGMERYVDAFEANDVDDDVLRDLTDADLEKLGVTLGHRKKLLRAIAALDEAPGPKGDAPAPPADDAPAASPAAVPAATDEPNRSEARSARPAALIGREHELDVLLERLARARDGEGQVVLLTGEAGVGTSRLVDALLDRLGDEAAKVMRHACSPRRAASPFAPFIDELERAAGITPGDSPERMATKLGTLVDRADAPDDALAVLASLLELPGPSNAPPTAMTAHQWRRRALEVLAGRIAGAAAEVPVVAIYEDVHWMDPSSRQLLDLVIERAGRLRALIVITSRTDVTPPWTGVTQLSIERLTRADSTRLIGQVAGKPLPGEVVERVVKTADGLPLFVDQLTRTLLGSDLLRDAGDRLGLTGEVPLLSIPTTLEETLRARLDRLGKTTGEVAEAGAAVGCTFARELLAAVLGRPEAELEAALDRLVEAELVVRRGTPPAAAYAFGHTLIRDVAYGGLSTQRRRQLHQEIAGALERSLPSAAARTPELLAWHAAEAGLVDDAIRHLERAGRRAAALAANAEALAHFDGALDLIRNQAESETRTRRELAALDARHAPLVAARGGAAPELETAFERASELACNLGDGRKLAQVLYGWYVYHVARAEHRAAADTAEQLAQLGEREGDPEAAAVGERSLGAALLTLGESERAVTHLETAAKLSSRGDPGAPVARFGHVPAVDARVRLAWLRWYKGRPDEAVDLCGQALHAARRAGNASSLADALLFGGIVIEMLRRNPGRVRGYATEVLSLAEAQGTVSWLAYGRAAEGWAQAALGDLAEGLAQMGAGLEQLRAAGCAHFRPFLLGLMAELESRRGAGDAALALLDEARASADRTGERWLIPDLLRVRGNLLLNAGSTEAPDVEAAYAEALAAARRMGATGLELRAAVACARQLRDRDRIEEAEHLLGFLLWNAPDPPGSPDLDEARALLDELRAGDADT